MSIGSQPTAAKDATLERLLNGRDIQVALMTNSTEPANLAALTEPATGGYARITLTAGGWIVGSGQASHADVQFSATGTDITGVYGVALIFADGTPELFCIIVDGENTPPLTITAGGDPYNVNLSNIIP